MKKLILVLLIVFVKSISVTNGQEEQGARVLSYSVEDIYFKKYDDSFIIKAELTEMSMVQNNYPEQLLQSVLSSTSYEWDIINTLGGKDKTKEKSTLHYETIKSMDKNLNYFKPLHKIEFQIGLVPIAIVKYIIYSDKLEKPMSAVMVMHKIEGRWYKTSTSMVSDIALLVWRFKTIELEKVIKGDVSDSILKEINKNVFVNGKLDFIKLSKEFESWYVIINDSNNAKIDYFKDPLTLF